MGLREAKKKQSARDIIESAVALFRERGYDATRVQDIVGRAGLSEATFFNYFPTKDAVLEAFALERVERYVDVLNAAVAASGHPVAERLREILRIIALGFVDDREFMAVVVMRSGLFMGARGAILEKEILTYDLLERLFREGQRRREFRSDIEPRQLAEIFTGAYMLTILNWLVRWWDNSTEPLDERLMRTADVFFDGTRARNTRRSGHGR